MNGLNKDEKSHSRKYVKVEAFCLKIAKTKIEALRTFSNIIFRVHGCYKLSSYFPQLLRYNRFTEVLACVSLPLFIFTKTLCCESLHTGMSFTDSKKVVVCHNRRIHQRKVFKGRAVRGKSSTGWFYGFKVHLVINEKGEILDFDLTPGNIADNNHSLLNRILGRVEDLCFGDKGYSTALRKDFFDQGLKIVTKSKRRQI